MDSVNTLANNTVEISSVAMIVLIALPMLGGALAWALNNYHQHAAKMVAGTTTLLSLLVLVICYQPLTSPPLETSMQWFPRFNIHFSLMLDGLSYLLILLTLLLTLLCVFISSKQIKEKQGFYYFNLLFSLSGIVGVFLASDLFLFFFFWEVMLLPITALILVWGYENRRYAAIKFFIFTQASSLLMLIAIIALAIIHFQQTSQYSFNFTELQQVSLTANTEMWLLLGFFVAFAVKLPAVPFHTWLPDAHTQAPTAGSVLLAGILLKTGAYGLLRLVLPLFPEAAQIFAPYAVTMGVVSIIYGAVMAFAQTDFKRLVAYSSISHMGFILLAVFSFNKVALDGALFIMVAHGVSSAALFSMAGAIQHRLHTRELFSMGGMWHSAPKMGVMLLIFMAAAVGLPGLANFVGEFMALVGSFSAYPVATSIAALGVIGSAIYGLKLFQRAFQGKPNVIIPDLGKTEMGYFSCLVILLFVLGVFPQIIFNVTEASMQKIHYAINNKSKTHDDNLLLAKQQINNATSQTNNSTPSTIANTQHNLMKKEISQHDD
ncbi:complex I subunit 4 family protein [Flocculibacter collagenilyticus]|uniref:complex I subunit 4 family protein n=1 Tax=Flocculibacter collagenilyticus TaxID=2744479 RepID=UPI0018F3C4E8|nr:NADH-quinone oxidoreductase subunit M [Flocculibacter collagenilyticus]